MAPAQPTAAPAPAVTASANAQDETLEIAGAGGVAVLLLAGGAFALYRRNRREDDEEAYEMAPVLVEEEPVVAQAPAMAAAPIVAMPRQTDDALPDGFDLSRFGPHVQAAYRGPTADNPSLSLKTRLKRARFYDMRERRAAEAGETPAATPAAAPARATETLSARSDEQIVYRPGRVTKGGFKPGFHRFSS
jgi:hypothetical protein